MSATDLMHDWGAITVYDSNLVEQLCETLMKPIIRLLCSTIILLAANVAHSTNYYVSQSTGNDANSGTSSGVPWKTLSKVNASSFSPGDIIYLKRGDLWAGPSDGLLSPCQATACSGTSAAQITIDAYGTGSAPLINSNGAAESPIFLRNQSYWNIQNLAVTNDVGSVTGYDYSGIQILCDSPSPARRTCQGIYIGHNTVSGVRGKLCDSPAGVIPHVVNCGTYWFYRLGRNAGITVLSNADAYYTAHNRDGSLYKVDNSNYFNDVRIEYNSVSSTDRVGIFVGNWINGQSDQFCSTGEQDCLITKSRSTNVVIQNNTVNQIGGDGILVLLTSGALLQYNLVSNSGNSVLQPNAPTGPSVGLWSAGATNTTIQHNEVYGEAGTGDRQAFDVDWGNISAYIQYNYSHNNAGGMLIIFEDNGVTGSLNTYIDDTIVRFNVSNNDGAQTAVISFCQGRWPIGANPTDIENNTIYQSSTNYSTAAGNVTNIFGICGIANLASCTGTPISGTGYVYNNIVESDGTVIYPAFTSSTIFSSNVFFNRNQSPSCEPYDGTKISTNPVFFTQPPSGVNDFKLRSTSPALTNGYLSAYLGPFDYWGNSVSTTVAPNRGAYDGPGL